MLSPLWPGFNLWSGNWDSTFKEKKRGGGLAVKETHRQ